MKLMTIAKMMQATTKRLKIFRAATNIENQIMRKTIKAKRFHCNHHKTQDNNQKNASLIQTH